jgi:hypothetical protein
MQCGFAFDIDIVLFLIGIGMLDGVDIDLVYLVASSDQYPGNLIFEIFSHRNPCMRVILNHSAGASTVGVPSLVSSFVYYLS